MVEGQLRDRTWSIPTFFNTTRTRVRSRYRPTSVEIHRSQMGRTRWETRAGFLSEVHPGLPVAVDTGKLRRSGVSQHTEQPADCKGRAGGRPAGDRIPEETDGHGDSRGISHGSVPCLRPTDQIVRRSIVTLRRATQTGLRMWSTQKN